jgi:predicted transcriptional regulator
MTNRAYPSHSNLKKVTSYTNQFYATAHFFPLKAITNKHLSIFFKKKNKKKTFLEKIEVNIVHFWLPFFKILKGTKCHLVKVKGGNLHLGFNTG